MIHIHPAIYETASESYLVTDRMIRLPDYLSGVTAATTETVQVGTDFHCLELDHPADPEYDVWASYYGYDSVIVHPRGGALLQRGLDIFVAATCPYYFRTRSCTGSGPDRYPQLRLIGTVTNIELVEQGATQFYIVGTTVVTYFVYLTFKDEVSLGLNWTCYPDVKACDCRISSDGIYYRVNGTWLMQDVPTYCWPVPFYVGGRPGQTVLVDRLGMLIDGLRHEVPTDVMDSLIAVHRSGTDDSVYLETSGSQFRQLNRYVFEMPKGAGWVAPNQFILIKDSQIWTAPLGSESLVKLGVTVTEVAYGGRVVRTDQGYYAFDGIDLHPL